VDKPVRQLRLSFPWGAGAFPRWVCRTTREQLVLAEAGEVVEQEPELRQPGLRATTAVAESPPRQETAIRSATSVWSLASAWSNVASRAEYERARCAK
jgi:hypothetical protein